MSKSHNLLPAYINSTTVLQNTGIVILKEY